MRAFSQLVAFQGNIPYKKFFALDFYFSEKRNILLFNKVMYVFSFPFYLYKHNNLFFFNEKSNILSKNIFFKYNIFFPKNFFLIDFYIFCFLAAI